MPIVEPSHVRDTRRARWFFWRGLALALVFGSGLAGFLLGADVTDRAGVADANIAAKIYYTVCLFVLGGVDLGTPTGGTALARALLWFAYFAAPIITASAVIEGVLRVMRPDRWRLRGLRNHVIIGGCGRLAMLYLKRMRSHNKRARAVVVEAKADHPYASAARELYRAQVFHGSIAADTIIASLKVDKARRIVLATGDDFANLDAAAKIIALQPGIGERVLVHVADLRFKNVMAHTRVATECHIFNIYQSAASHLVDTDIVPYFEHTEFRDIIVLAGFGRLGQTILASLQERAAGSMSAVIIVDVDAEERAMVFGEQVGFSDCYERHIVEGDINDLGVWQRVEELYDLSSCAPAFLLVSGNDGLNVRIALRMGKRFPTSLVLARTYFRSSFVDDVSEDANFQPFSVAELIHDSLPEDWL